MLHLIQQTGAKGNVNFDGVGYEKLAAEDPEYLFALREAVQQGKVEPVGCSYGQPYGLFHGGESNIRQRIYGVRAVRRLLGVWPQTFWEEEFDFFPQLPQILAQTGFKYASLYFQWTWHTPEVPKEPHSAILWQGIDGTTLVTAPRNNLNLHQWPEDFQILLDDLAAKGPQQVLGSPNGEENQTPPLILQWLELMPSPDWMCRSEVMLPKLQELLQDPRFEVTCQTLGEYLATQNPKSLPLRSYSLDQTWHGLTLGKNGTYLPGHSAEIEEYILTAETLHTTLSLFGRPYRQWDVYATWEIEEAWRNLLIGQHHDNDECEGLCGDIGWHYYRSAKELAKTVYHRTVDVWFDPWKDEESSFKFNQFGWPIQYSPNSSPTPPFGWGLITEEEDVSEDLPPLNIEGVGQSWPKITFQRNGEDYSVTFPPEFTKNCDSTNPEKILRSSVNKQSHVDAVTVHLQYAPGEEPLTSRPQAPWIDPGFKGALKLPVPLSFQVAKTVIASPYAVHEHLPSTGQRLRKYPEGDWMTSPQWFEEVPEAFVSHGFVDFIDEDGKGVLVVTKQPMQWLVIDGVPNLVLSAYDPWDENKHHVDFNYHLTFMNHGPMTNAERYRLTKQLNWGHSDMNDFSPDCHPNIPDRFGPLNLTSDTDGVVATAFYRETEDFAGKHVENYAGTGMGYPTILRLVEFNGDPADVTLQLAGPLAKAYKTNLLGQIQEEIPTEPCHTPDFGHPFEWSELKFKMNPREILTLYLDIVPARKQTRDLDAKREVWATVHRVEDKKD